MPIGIVRATSTFNIDGNFSYAETYPYSVQCTSSGSTTCGNPQFNQAPWQTYSWGVSSYRWCVGSSGFGTVDSYSFNIGSGSSYVLVSDAAHSDACTIGVSVAEFIQGLSSGRAGWPSPAPMPTSGENTKVSYNLERHYVSISLLEGEMGILFDVRADEYYNGVLLHKDLLMDFYVHQECDGFSALVCGLGPNVGDKTCRPAPDAYVCEWRIHTNIADNTWVSDNVDISNYITQSAQYAVCIDQGQPSNCSLGPTTVNLKSFEVITEGHFASEGLTLGSANLYQTYPTTPSAPSGPTSVRQGGGGTYTTSATDPSGALQYQFDWGDLSTTTTGWYASGSTASASHAWNYPGGYSVRVRATDGAYWSDWSQITTVYVQNTRCPPICSPTP